MKDLLTGEDFEPTKSNQKFANAKNRIKYNNMQANSLRKEKSALDKPLSNNLKILNDLMLGKTEEQFHSQFLLGRGFDFKAFNGAEEYNGVRGYCIYQYIMIHENQYTKIARHDR